jgi:hypothetical protein
LALAALAYARRAAILARDRWIDRLGDTRVEGTLYVAGLLFSVGMTEVARSQLEAFLWLLMALTFAAQLVILRMNR